MSRARLLALGAFIVVDGVVTILALAFVLEQFVATEVTPITPKAPEVVATERALWSPGDPVAELYGVPGPRPVKVLFVEEARILHPQEDPSLALLPVDKEKGENPLQTATVWFVAIRAAGAGLFLALLLGVLAWRARRRGI